MTSRRAVFFVLFLAVTAYLNSLGNGFAYDDNGVIVQNPAVVSGELAQALTGSYWPDPLEGTGLYRPVTTTTFALEWMAFGDAPLGFHAVNILSHALLSLLLFFLILQLGSLTGALAGAGLFAIHPVHTEVVANVVGQGEMLSGGAFLLACLLYLKGRTWKGARRGFRLVALGVLYLLSLGAKEIGVTLPGVLLAIELLFPASTPATPSESPGRPAPLVSRLWREAATFLLLGVVLVGYLGARTLILGTVLGEVPATVFLALSPVERFLTACAVWPQFLRLSLFPWDLSADYAPGVLFPSTTVDGGVLLGFLCCLALVLLAIRAYRSAPLVSLGILWFGITVLPVSNLLFQTGTLLAERTLYLPSVGLSLIAAGLAKNVLSLKGLHRALVLAGVALFGLGLFVRTVVRNPSWFSTYVVLETLNQEHPESYMSWRARGTGLDRVGDWEAAREAFDMAVSLVPNHYGMLVEVGEFRGRTGDWGGGEHLLRRAIALVPGRANAYQILASQLLRQERGREGHRVALQGLARVGSDRELWALVSESYVLKGDLPAAVRAREAALAADPTASSQWGRLGELLSAMGEEERAAAARERARALEDSSGEGREGR